MSESVCVRQSVCVSERVRVCLCVCEADLIWDVYLGSNGESSEGVECGGDE